MNTINLGKLKGFSGTEKVLKNTCRISTQLVNMVLQKEVML